MKVEAVMLLSLVSMMVVVVPLLFWAHKVMTQDPK